jgi:eukaryotic-like serine/threonine-protein kinase
MAQQLRIFISSPGDVEDERRRAALVVSRLKREFIRFFELSAVLWEYEPMLSSGHFQDIIEPPSTADIVVVILWSRLGTPLPPRTDKREYKRRDGSAPVTGTEWEYEDALTAREQRGTPELLVYRKFSEGFARFSHADQLEQIRAQWQALQTFWERHFQGADGGFKAAFNRFQALDDFESQLEAHLRELLRRRLPPQPLRIARGTAGAKIDWWSGSPYGGLKAFDLEQAAVFFGRERAEREITENLVRRAAAGSAFMLVLGASGAGKSSLVRAGLLPDLMAPGVVADVATWRYAIVQPSDLAPDPFAGLAAALLRGKALPELATIGYDAKEVAAILAGDPALAAVPLRLALQRAAEDEKSAPSATPRGRLVLVLDQLEVLFTSAAFSEAALAKLDALLAQLAQSGLVWVIATMRSDFYHRMIELPQINALAAGYGQYLLPAPSAAEIEQIIRGPADVAGLDFEVDQHTGLGLDAVILEAAARDPASLPLLSFVLDELYRRDVGAGDNHVLRFGSYRELGGLEGAIARHADELVQGLSPEQAAALPALLLSLVEVDDLKATATARVVARAALTHPAHHELADRLVAARLAVADDAGAGKTLRLAHEALLSHWPRLSTLTAEHRDFLIVRRRLQADAAAWRRSGRHDDFLLPPGRRLAEAEEALALRRHDLDPDIVAYAEASIAAERERQAAIQRTKEEALRRELARSRRIAAVVSVLLLLAVAGGIFAWHERGVATTALGQAEKNYQLALGQSVNDLQLLEENYDDGNLSTAILRALVGRAQDTVAGLSDAGDTDEVLAARTKLLDIVALMEVSIGDTKAVETARQELALAERLKNKDAKNPRWQRLYAMASGELSDVLFWQCDCVAAAEQARQAAVAAKELLAATPDDDFLHERLLTDYETRGDALRVMGDLDGADEAFGTELQDLKDSLARHPGEKRWLADLAFTTERIGDELLLKGQPAEAVVQYQTDNSTASDLVQKNPQDANYLSALVQSDQRLGDAAMAQNDLARAREQYNEYLARATTLSNSDPANFRFRDFYATAYQRLGEVDMAEKNFAAALDQFNTYLSMAKELLSRNASNKLALYDVANAHTKVGDAKSGQGDLAGALDAYRQAETAALELADRNCQNGAWQRMLALTHQRVAAALKAQGDAAAARSAFLQCAAIAVKPTVWSPAALWPKDVTTYCNNEVAQLDSR